MSKRLQAAFDQYCRDKLHAGLMTEEEYIALLRHRDVWQKCRSVCADICEDMGKQVEQGDDGNVFYNRAKKKFAEEIARTLRPENQ